MIRTKPSSCRNVGALLLGSVLVAACTSDDEPSQGGTTPTNDTTPTADTAVDTATDTAVPDDTGVTDTATGPIFDCSTIPEQPLSITQLNAPRGYHDVAFDTDDNIIGSDNSVLLAVAPDDSFEVFVPALGTVEQMAWLHDGDLAIAEDGSGAILRITPDGARTVLATDVDAYGLIVGPDGMVYTANNDVVHRIDPATGHKTVLVEGNGFSPKVLTFNRDHTRLYMGTLLDGGAIYYVDLDVNLLPMGGPKPLVNGLGGWHDGLGMDVCGNLYLADYTTSALYRITESGKVQTLLDPDLTYYGHGLEWGTGSGGWLETAIYMPQPYNGNTVVEVDLGVPSADWEGTAIGTVPF